MTSPEPKLSAADRALLASLQRSGSNLSLPHVIEHYLYFPKETAACDAAETLRGEGYEVEVRLGADGVNWLVLASHAVLPAAATVARTTLRLEALASSLSGEYDGWEATVAR
jgi:hypothetical protein